MSHPAQKGVEPILSFCTNMGTTGTRKSSRKI